MARNTEVRVAGVAIDPGVLASEGWGVWVFVTPGIALPSPAGSSATTAAAAGQSAA